MLHKCRGGCLKNDNEDNRPHLCTTWTISRILNENCTKECRHYCTLCDYTFITILITRRTRFIKNGAKILHTNFNFFVLWIVLSIQKLVSLYDYRRSSYNLDCCFLYLGRVYTKCQRQRRVNAAMTLVIQLSYMKSIESLQNRWLPHSGASIFGSIIFNETNIACVIAAFTHHWC